MHSFLISARVPVYTVSISSRDNDPRLSQQGDKVLDLLATASGGKSFGLTSGASAQTVFDQVRLVLYKANSSRNSQTGGVSR